MPEFTESTDAIKRLYANRFFAAYGIAFFALWGLATVISDYFALETHYTVMAGIIASTVLDELIDWLHTWRRARQEVNENVA